MLHFCGDGSELKKKKAYFSEIEALTVESNTETKTNGKMLVTETDSVAMGELKFAHPHSQFKSKMMIFLQVSKNISPFLMVTVV